MVCWNSVFFLCLAGELKSIAESGRPLLSVAFTDQNRTEWRTAAILLAVSLGLTSCLFGILVGRCRARKGSFSNERSRAAATSRLRRRILKSRGLVNGDIEKDGLLTRLQL